MHPTSDTSPVTSFIDELTARLQKELPSCKIEKEIYQDVVEAEGEIHLQCASDLAAQVIFYISINPDSPFIECALTLGESEDLVDNIFSGTYALHDNHQLDFTVDFIQIHNLLPVESRPEVVTAVQVFNQLSNQSIFKAFNRLEAEFRRHWGSTQM